VDLYKIPSPFKFCTLKAWFLWAHSPSCATFAFIGCLINTKSYSLLLRALDTKRRAKQESWALT